MFVPLYLAAAGLSWNSDKSTVSGQSPRWSSNHKGGPWHRLLDRTYVYAMADRLGHGTRTSRVRPNAAAGVSRLRRRVQHLFRVLRLTIVSSLGNHHPTPPDQSTVGCLSELGSIWSGDWLSGYRFELRGPDEVVAARQTERAGDIRRHPSTAGKPFYK